MRDYRTFAEEEEYAEIMSKRIVIDTSAYNCVDIGGEPYMFVQELGIYVTFNSLNVDYDPTIGWFYQVKWVDKKGMGRWNDYSL